MSVYSFNSFSSNCAVLMKVPRACAWASYMYKKKNTKKGSPRGLGGFRNFCSPPNLIICVTSNSVQDCYHITIPPQGEGGVPRIIFLPKIVFFCELKPHAQFQNPTITPSGRNVCGTERKKGKGK